MSKETSGASAGSAAAFISFLTVVSGCETLNARDKTTAGLIALSDPKSNTFREEPPGMGSPAARVGGLRATIFVDPKRERYTVQLENTSDRALHHPLDKFRKVRTIPAGVFVVGRTGTQALTWFSTVRGISDLPWSPYYADGVIPVDRTETTVLEPRKGDSFSWELRILLAAYLQNLTPDSIEKCQTLGGEYRILLALPDATGRLVLLGLSEWKAVPNDCRPGPKRSDEPGVIL
jgi:hypothetical protein